MTATKTQTPSVLNRKSAWHLCLYIADMTPRSMNAVTNLKWFCRKQLAGRCKLDVIDVLAHPQIAVAENIVALPTLVRKAPKPQRIVIGDLADTARVLRGLDVRLLAR